MAIRYRYGYSGSFTELICCAIIQTTNKEAKHDSTVSQFNGGIDEFRITEGVLQPEEFISKAPSNLGLLLLVKWLRRGGVTCSGRWF